MTLYHIIRGHDFLLTDNSFGRITMGSGLSPLAIKSLEEAQAKADEMGGEVSPFTI